MRRQSSWTSLSIFLFFLTIIVGRVLCEVDVDYSVCHNFNDCHFRNSPTAMNSVIETKDVSDDNPMKPPSLKWYAAEQNFVDMLLRWRQENHVANSDYDLDSYSSDELSRMIITGTSEPDRSATERAEASLISDLIDCRFQEAGPITPRQNPDVFLSFRYWTSPLVVLHVCVLPLNNNFTSIIRKPEAILNAKCQQVNVDRGHRPASLRLPISEFSSKPFIITITADNFLHPAGGYALVDQLKLNGTCGRNVNVGTTIRQFMVPQNRTFYDQLLASTVDGPFSLSEYVHLRKMWRRQSEDAAKILPEVTKVHRSPARNPSEIDSLHHNNLYFRTEPNTIVSTYSTKSANNVRQMKDAEYIDTTSTVPAELEKNSGHKDSVYFRTEPNSMNTIYFSKPMNKGNVNSDVVGLRTTSTTPAEEEFEWSSNSTDDPILQLINAATLRAITGLLSFSPAPFERLNSQEDLNEVQSEDTMKVSKLEENEGDAMNDLFKTTIKPQNVDESGPSHLSINRNIFNAENISSETQEFNNNQANTPSLLPKEKETPVTEWKSDNSDQKEGMIVSSKNSHKLHVETLENSNDNEEEESAVNSTSDVPNEVNAQASSSVIDNTSPNHFQEAPSDDIKKLMEVDTSEASNKTESVKSQMIQSEDPDDRVDNPSALDSVSDSDCKYKASKSLVTTTTAPIVAHLQKECDCVFRKVFKVVARNLARVQINDMTNNGTMNNTAPKISPVIDNSTMPPTEWIPNSEAIDSIGDEDDLDHSYEYSNVGYMEMELTERKLDREPKLDASRESSELSIHSATPPNMAKEEQSEEGKVVNATQNSNNAMTTYGKDRADELQNEKNSKENHKIVVNKAEQTTKNNQSIRGEDSLEEDQAVKSLNESKVDETIPAPEIVDQILSTNDAKKEIDKSSMNSIEPVSINGEHFPKSESDFSKLPESKIVLETLNPTSIRQKSSKTARDLNDKFRGVNSANDNENGTSTISPQSDGTDNNGDAVIRSHISQNNANFEEENIDNILEPTNNNSIEKIASNKFDKSDEESLSLASSMRNQGQNGGAEYMDSVEQDNSNNNKSAKSESTIRASVEHQEVTRDGEESLETLLRMLDGRRFRVISQIFFDENGDKVKQEKSSDTFQQSHPPATTSDDDQSQKQQRGRLLTQESSKDSNIESHKWLPALLEAQLPTQVAKKYANNINRNP